MLLDRRHKPWFIGTTITAFVAISLYAILGITSSDELTGGSPVGLWYGIFSAGLMAIAGLLSLIRRLPPWRIFSRPTWLRAHLWLGSLAVVFLVCHSGGRLGGPLERLLWLTTAGIVVTGVAGLLLQQVLPRLLRVRVPCEAPPGHLSDACRQLHRRGDVLLQQICGVYDPRAAVLPAGRSPADARQQLRALYEKEVRPFLAWRGAGSSILADPLQAAHLFARLQSISALAEFRACLTELASLCDERRQLSQQERLSFWLHSWLLLHVPLAGALFVLVGAHIASALYY
jgi:hypothetical protein